MQMHGSTVFSVEIEQLPQEALAFLFAIVLVLVMRLMRITVARRLCLLGCLYRGLLWLCGSWCRTVDDLVQLAAIKPNATAVRAVIDFNPLPVGHEQLYVLAYGAIHVLVLSNQISRSC